MDEFHIENGGLPTTSSVGSEIMDIVGVALGFTQWAEPFMGPAKAVLALGQSIHTTIETIRTNRAEFAILLERLDRIFKMIRNAVQFAAMHATSCLPTLTDAIVTLKSNLEAISGDLKMVQTRIERRGLWGYLRNSVTSTSTSKILKRCSDKLERNVSLFQTDAIMSSVTGTAALRQDNILDRLPQAGKARHKSVRPDKIHACCPGTRADLIEDMKSWLDDRDGPTVLWVEGEVGSGKTTLAYTLAEIASERSSLGGSFFFSRHCGDGLDDPFMLFPTLAYQLAGYSTPFRVRLASALLKDFDSRNIANEQLAVQAQRLLRAPLAQISHNYCDKVVLLVVDALDEIEDTNLAKEIFQHIVDIASEVPFLKILITGRPMLRLQSVTRSYLHSPHIKSVILHEVPSDVVKGDIRRYLTESLKSVTQDLHHATDWYTSTEIEQLVKHCGSSFLLVGTLARKIADNDLGDPRVQLDSLLDQSTSGHAAQSDDIHQVYLQVLERSLPAPFLPVLHEQYRNIMGLMMLTQSQLSLPAMEKLAGMAEGSSLTTLNRLQSVIILPVSDTAPPIFFHPSFGEFISDPNLCQSTQYVIDKQEQETRLALWCLTHLNTKLSKGKLGYTMPSPHLKKKKGYMAAFPTHLLHACKSWAHHLERAYPGAESLKEALATFTSLYLFAWLEAIIYLDHPFKATQGFILPQTLLRQAANWASLSSCDVVTIRVLEDCAKFVQARAFIFYTPTRQLYRSAIPFLPSSTALYENYQRDADTLAEVIVGPETWLQERARTTTPSTVEFSKDGVMLVSWRADGSVSAWDVATGEHAWLQEGRPVGQVMSLWFRDGCSRALAKCSDGTFTTWNVGLHGTPGVDVLPSLNPPANIKTFGSIVTANYDDGRSAYWDFDRMSDTDLQSPDPTALTGDPLALEFSLETLHHDSCLDKPSIKYQKLLLKSDAGWLQDVILPLSIDTSTMVTWGSYVAFSTKNGDPVLIRISV